MMVDAMARGGTRNHTGEWPVGSRYWKPAHDYVCAQLAGAATPHLHDEWQFAVPSQAAALLLGGFAHHPARAGHVVMVHPYDVHAESAVERARAHLIGRPAEPPSLQEMASVAGVGASHLVRTFSLDIGLPPRSYHVQARLALARRLLAEGRPVTWVAYECGFADQSHLSRRFKASYGLTPGSFQAQCMSRSAPASGSDAA